MALNREKQQVLTSEKLEAQNDANDLLAKLLAVNFLSIDQSPQR